MKDVKNINRIAKKMDDLIRYAKTYINRDSMRKVKHNSTNKLFFYKDPNDKSKVVVQYGGQVLFDFSFYQVYTPPNSIKHVIIDGYCMDLKEYDKADIFSLSTMYDIELLKWLQVSCRMKETHIRTVCIFDTISEQLINDAHSAYSTQYQEIDKERFHLYKG